MSGNCGKVRLVQTILVSFDRSNIRVEHDERGDVGLPVANSDDLTDQRRGRLDRILDIGRRQVLTRLVNQQFLLAIDDRDIAVGADLSDVAGSEPTVGIHRFRGLLRLISIAPHHDRSTHEQFAILAQSHFHAADGSSDGADRQVAIGGHCGHTGRLRHPPHFEDRDSHPQKEAQHFRRNRCGPGRSHPYRVHPDGGADLRQDQFVGQAMLNAK